MQDRTQKNLFDYVSEGITDDDSAPLDSEGIVQHRKQVTTKQASTSQSGDANSSNWFDDLDEDDFNFMDSNMLAVGNSH